MNTSGPLPPEIWVVSVARFVSVSVGALIRWTLMPGYAFSKAVIHTFRTSGPLVVIGLAHQLIVPLVGLPAALPADDESFGLVVLDEPPPPDPPLLEPQAATPTARPAAASSAVARRTDRPCTGLRSDAVSAADKNDSSGSSARTRRARADDAMDAAPAARVGPVIALSSPPAVPSGTFQLTF